MIEFDAFYYDGKTSARAAVRVRGLAHSLHITGSGINTEIALVEVRVDARVGDARRTLALPGGAQLQTDDHTALAALFPRAHRLESWVQTLERKWGYALAAIALIAAFTWWCAVFGVPLAATAIANATPATVESTLGEHTLATLDKSMCDSSALPAARVADVQKHFSTLINGLNDGYAYRLEFRACGGFGANAIALPGGVILVTDELVKLAQNDQQIAAVLAHEIGHVHHKHGLRRTLQSAGVAALVAALAGDAVTITKLAVLLPTVLLQSGYSREFETDADTYAFERMKAIGLSAQYFAEIMTLLEQQHNARSGTPAEKTDAARTNSRHALDYLSTHPATAERIDRARNYR